MNLLYACALNYDALDYGMSISPFFCVILIYPFDMYLKVVGLGGWRLFLFMQTISH